MTTKSEDVFDPFDSTSYSQSPVSSHSNPTANYQSGAILQPRPASIQSASSLQIQNGSISQSDEMHAVKSPTVPDVDTSYLDDQFDDVEVTIIILLHILILYSDICCLKCCFT